MHELVIIGGGPAGLTAAIYASRAGLKTLLVESYSVPGQAVLTSDIENYPGFPEGLSGFELMDKFKKQAEKFGTEFKTGDVRGVKAEKTENKPAWEIELADGKVLTLSVIIAAGSSPKKLGVPGEDKFRGKGLSYCATCDGAFFKNKNVAVIGGGDTAAEEALFLTKFANKVTMIHRRDRLRATKILVDRAFANKKIEYIWNSTVIEILGKEKVNAVKIKNLKDGKEADFPCDGIFIFAGYSPNTQFLKGLLEIDKDGYVISNENMETAKEGIFVCGDARQKFLRQIVTASGDGAVAAVSARLYIEELKGIAYK